MTPGSSSVFNTEIIARMQKHPFKRALDFGAGSGKFAALAREACPDAKCEAVEIEPSYVHQFDLVARYEHVYIESAQGFFLGRPNYVTDLIIMGDFLEHLSKSDGLDLVHDSIHRCRELWIIYPVGKPQFAVGGVVSEVHRSVWSPIDWYPFEILHQRVEGPTHWVILRGYQT